VGLKIEHQGSLNMPANDANFKRNNSSPRKPPQRCRKARGGYAALNAAGEKINVFAKQADAVRAVMAEYTKTTTRAKSRTSRKQ
jgi:hypothetical protein